MVQVLRRAQAAHKVVPIATIVIRALDLSQVRTLVNIRRRLVLGVARARQRRQPVKVQVAVGHVAGARQRVREHLPVARAVHVGAVVPAHTGIGRAALGRDAGEDVGDGVARAAGGVFEVLRHLGRRARGRRALGRGREGRAVAEGLLGDLQLAAGAVALYAGALVVERETGVGRLGAVDGGLDAVGAVGHGADELVGVGLRKGEDAIGADVEGAAGGEVVHLGYVKGYFDGRARGDVLECVIFEVVGGDVEAETVEFEVLACLLVSCKWCCRVGGMGVCKWDIPLAETVAFSTADESKMVPVLRTLRLFLPLLVMVALTAELPAISSWTSRGVGPPRGLGAAAAMEARATKPARNFMMNRIIEE